MLKRLAKAEAVCRAAEKWHNTYEEDAKELYEIN